MAEGVRSWTCVEKLLSSEIKIFPQNPHITEDYIFFFLNYYYHGIVATMFPDWGLSPTPILQWIKCPCIWQFIILLFLTISYPYWYHFILHRCCLSLFSETHFQRKVTGLFLLLFLTCSWLQNSMPEEIRITKLTGFRSHHRLHLAVVHLPSITISWNWTEECKSLQGFLEFKMCRHHSKSNGKSIAAITKTLG